MHASRRLQVTLFFLLATFLFWVGDYFWGSLLVRPDEPLYTRISLEMRQRGDFLVPHLNGNPSFVKPPLVYWLELSGRALFGASLFALRFPVWILALLTAVLVYRIGRMLYSEEAAWTASVLLLCNAFFFPYAQSDMMEVPLVFFLMLAFYAFLRAEREHPAWLLVCGGSLGFSSLVKGPIGIVLGLLLIALYAARFGSLYLFRTREVFFGLLLLLAAAGWWPLLVFRLGHGTAFVREFILGENFGKFAGPVMPVKILGIGLFAGIAPWTFLFMESLWKSFRADPRRRFLLEWIGLVILVFILPARKLPHYVMPALPAASLLMATHEGWSRVSIWLTRGLLTAIGFFWLLGMRLDGSVWVGGILVLGSMGAFLAAYFLKEPQNLFRSGLLFGILLSTLPVAAPAIQIQGQQAAVRELARLPEVAVFCPDDRDPRGFELSLRFGSAERIEEARRVLARGGTVVYAERDARFFGGMRLETVKTWRAWRTGIGLGHVLRALWTGNPAPLTEEMRAVRKS